MKKPAVLESGLQKRLEELKAIPPRDPRLAAQARARFRAQVLAAREPQGNKGWGSLFNKPQFAINLIVALLVIVGLFTGGKTTVKAAQNELPGQPLYTVKTVSEDISLQFEPNAEAKINRLLELSQIRIQEITQLIESGQTPPDQVTRRLEKHLTQTLQLCSRLDDAKLDQTLPRVRRQLQKYDQEMQGLKSQATQNALPILEETHAMVQIDLYVLNGGLNNTESFRGTVRRGFYDGQRQILPTGIASPISGPPQEKNASATPFPGGQETSIETDTPANPPNSHVTPTPRDNGNGSGSGNNAGGNGKGNGQDKGKSEGRRP